MATSIGGLVVNNPLAVSSPTPTPTVTNDPTPSYVYYDPKAFNGGGGVVDTQQGPLPSTNMSAYTQTATTGGSSTPQTFSDSQGTTFSTQAAADASSAKLAALQGEVDASKNQIVGMEGSSAQNAANQFDAGATGAVNAEQNATLGFNSQRENNALNRFLSIANIVDQVRSGIHSGTISLGNANSLASSAALEMAKAYGHYGAMQTNNVNGQSELADNQLDAQQAQAQTQEEGALNQLKSVRDQALTQVESDTRLRLAQLDATRQSEGLTNPVDIQGAAAQIIADGQAKMAAIDQKIQSMMQAGVQAESRDSASSKAHTAFTSGQIPDNMGLFSFSQTPTVSNLDPNAALNDPSSQGAPLAQVPLFVKKTN